MVTRKNDENKAVCSIPCNACGSETVEELSLKARNGSYLRTIICQKCGLIWSDPRPSEDQLRKYYASDYRREYKGVCLPKLKHIYRDANDALLRYRFLEEILSEDASILDIGSGTGVFVYVMRKIGFNAAGLEPSEDYAKYSLDELHIPVQIGFIQDVEDSTRYDVITLNHVLEHLDDPLGTLHEIAALLKQGGFLALGVPNAENTRQDPKNRYHLAHLYTFNPEILAYLGKRAGFEVYKQRIAPFSVNSDLIFQKTGDSSLQDFQMTDNYQKITTILNKHTNFRHFTSPTPYRKLARKAVTVLK
ncbi:MAG: methyltransferase domain-containing protein, partial [Deltaproteobacteria bacterium]|nr:methyltransferase domain-containing protein [Deltaproteobacteria bacterium]